MTTATVVARAGNTILPVTVALSPDGLVATVTPVVPFPQGTAILVTVNGIKDVAGNPLAVPFTSEFTTSGTASPPGIIVGEVYDDRRSLPLEEMGERLILATLAGEDQDFFEHQGVDARAIVRAVGQNVRHARLV